MRERHAHGPNDGLLLRPADEGHALAPAGGLVLAAGMPGGGSSRDPQRLR